MPASFNKCVKQDGKVVTKKLPKGRYKHLCKDSGGGWHAGETKIKKRYKDDD